MQPCNIIYYSTVHWRLNMFRTAHCSSSGALTVFTVSGLHKHVVTDRSQVWVGTDYGRSPNAYVNQRLQIQLKLLMMSSMLLETCWAFNERWNNTFYYKAVSCWLFLLSVKYAIMGDPFYNTYFCEFCYILGVWAKINVHLTYQLWDTGVTMFVWTPKVINITQHKTFFQHGKKHNSCLS
jgi:hypothetical protein